MGEELTFLKRRHVLLSDELMLIKSHHKHIGQLKETVGLHPTAYPKNTPSHPAINDEDSALLNRDVKVSKHSRHVAVFSSTFTTLSALHGVVFWGKSRYLF